MANDDDVSRALSGRALWNKWAEERLANNEAPVVDFSRHQIDEISFEGFVFPGPADFSVTAFMKSAMFGDAIFHADVKMDRTAFNADANFNNAEFKKSANFDHARFRSFANFKDAKFEGFVARGTEFSGEANFEDVRFNHSEFTGVKFKHALTRFTGAVFRHVPDFRAATFETSPLFQRVKVNYARYRGANVCRRWLSCAAGDDDAVRFRRLKELASAWKDHERELEFFANELRAKRFHETKNCGAIALNWAYGWLSDFGQSVLRPAIGLLVLTCLAWLLILLNHSTICAATLEQLLAALMLSLTDWALLLGSEKWEIRNVAFSNLCGECVFGVRAGLLSYLQSAVSLFLFFLLGLGLRNRFRTGSA